MLAMMCPAVFSSGRFLAVSVLKTPSFNTSGSGSTDPNKSGSTSLPRSHVLSTPSYEHSIFQNIHPWKVYIWLSSFTLNDCMSDLYIKSWSNYFKSYLKFCKIRIRILLKRRRIRTRNPLFNKEIYEEAIFFSPAEKIGFLSSLIPSLSFPGGKINGRVSTFIS